MRPPSLTRIATILLMRAMRYLSPRSWRMDVLEIALSGEMPEELPHTSWIRRFYRARMAFGDYLFTLREAKSDRNLKFVVFHIDDPAIGWAQACELRKAIKDLRDAGLATIAHLDSADNIGYYVASACDEIFLTPTGQVMLRGLASEAMFFKGALDKVKVEAEFMHVGKFKSASELFTRKEMSPAHREEIEHLLDGMYSMFVSDLASDRRVTPKAMEKLIDRGGFLAREAKDGGLVDKLCYADEIEEIVESRIGRHTRWTDISRYPTYRAVDLPLDVHTKPLPRVALLYATGPISMGSSSDYSPQGPTVGAETLSEAVRYLRESKDIAGVVLRIDSPGGSALASDLIWREISLLNEEHKKSGDDDAKKKPFVVSMGDVAASGGYYIACGADKIFASPATITGSIGVVAGKFNLKGLFDMLGIGVETIVRGKSADRDSAMRAFTPNEKKRLKAEMEDVYDVFVDRVATGRKMNDREVEKVAQGRVWSGSQALKHGLVDEIGGLIDAIDEVKKMAGIPPDGRVFIDSFPRRKRFVKLPGPFGAKVADMALEGALSMLPKKVRAMIPILKSRDPLAIIPYHLEIK